MNKDQVKKSLWNLNHNLKPVELNKKTNLELIQYIISMRGNMARLRNKYRDLLLDNKSLQRKLGIWR